MRLEQYSYTAKKEKRRRISAFIFICIFVFILINLIFKFLLFPVQQTSISMEPDISKNSFLMVTPLPVKIRRGDVVYIESRKSENLSFIKQTGDIFTRFFTAQKINLKNSNRFPGTQNELRRVIGMPGDTYYIRDYVMYIKPAGESHYLTEFEIIDKKYNVNFSVAPANWDSGVGVKGYSDPETLGPNEYFILGDNRKTCSDSRLFGAVSKNEIKGKALFLYFPFNKIKLF